ncbi:MAG TPA: vitamin K epoxide reductase family protein [Anaeromyxobacteraceae bacterium]|nr:vitamin K epoxide reductase family protein [Anaeromyxobacteraceae bacterium]
MSRRPALAAAAALAVAGMALSVLLTRQHASAHAGIASACNINAFVNCDRVATSRWSVFLGLPVAVWGIFGYGLALGLSGFGLAGRRPHPTWPAGFLFATASVAAAVAVTLALVSEVAIGALCLYCAGSWLVSFGLLAAAWRACRPEGIRAALRADFALLGVRPGRTAAFALAAAALVVIAAKAQPRYWDKPPPPAAPIRLAPGAVPGVGAPAAGRSVVVEFSDYECPFCAKAHKELRALLAARPDVTLVKRHFPLDTACNPVMKRPLHERACALARAAICAEAQGRFAEMDDALFENQGAKRPVDELASSLGLDLPRFRACLADPETSRRLSSDIATGMQVGLRATPTYVVDGVQYTGSLPASALPPPRP